MSLFACVLFIYPTRDGAVNVVDILFSMLLRSLLLSNAVTVRTELIIKFERVVITNTNVIVLVVPVVAIVICENGKFVPKYFNIRKP